jgi:hypothetical protein
MSDQRVPCVSNPAGEWHCYHPEDITIGNREVCCWCGIVRAVEHPADREHGRFA